MRRTSWISGFLAGALVAGTGLAFGQAPGPPKDKALPPPPPGEFDAGPLIGEKIEILGFDAVAASPAVKGAPFSATAITESTHTLADGNRIHRTTQTALFRDGQGRLRREVSIPGIGPLAASGKPRSFVSITDPVAGVRFALMPDRKVARKTELRRRDLQAGFSRRWENRLSELESEGKLKAESLGTQTIEGVSAEGTRYTRVIPPGAVGNDKEIDVVTEQWHSKELQVTMLVKRHDPRFGDTVYRLTNVKQGEQDPALFQVPSDYTIREGRGGFGGRMQRRKEGPPPPGPPAPGKEL